MEICSAWQNGIKIFGACFTKKVTSNRSFGHCQCYSVHMKFSCHCHMLFGTVRPHLLFVSSVAKRLVFRSGWRWTKFDFLNDLKYLPKRTTFFPLSLSFSFQKHEWILKQLFLAVMTGMRIPFVCLRNGERHSEYSRCNEKFINTKKADFGQDFSEYLIFDGGNMWNVCRVLVADDIWFGVLWMFGTINTNTDSNHHKYIQWQWLLLF